MIAHGHQIKNIIPFTIAYKYKILRFKSNNVCTVFVCWEQNADESNQRRCK